MNIKDIVAIMAVKTYPKDEVGKLRSENNGGGLTLSNTPEKDVEFYTEEDFEEPKRENFESAISALLDGKADLDEGVKIHYLAEYKIGAQHWE